MVAAGISSTQKEAYRNVLRRLSISLDRPSTENLVLADHLKYVAFSASTNGVCLTRNQFWNAILHGQTFTGFEVPLKQKDNIFALSCIYGNPYRENVHPLCSMVVYQPAAADSDVHLDIRTVALQVPKNLTERVDSFALCLREDAYEVDSYNYLLGAYEFEVVLFGK